MSAEALKPAARFALELAIISVGRKKKCKVRGGTNVRERSDRLVRAEEDWEN